MEQSQYFPAALELRRLRRAEHRSPVRQLGECGVQGRTPASCPVHTPAWACVRTRPVSSAPSWSRPRSPLCEGLSSPWAPLPPGSVLTMGSLRPPPNVLSSPWAPPRVLSSPWAGGGPGTEKQPHLAAPSSRGPGETRTARRHSASLAAERKPRVSGNWRGRGHLYLAGLRHRCTRVP